ncbi:MAG TPA: tetratricopeptide repeat protein [Vicinamibacterales bacterium]
MPIDREATLKQAEKLLRQGKLDGAIAEYVRLVEDQPRDWNAMNALGDLYVRAGNAERAVVQFTRIADFLAGEGFLPKAAALYKKALKAEGGHEHTLNQLGEIATRQGLFADAKTYFRQLAQQRRARGDERGAAEILVRLGSAEQADVESKVAGARAALEVGDAALAASLMKSAGEALAKQGRKAEALNVFAEAAQLDPGDTALRARLAGECVAAGDFERARLFLTAEAAGDDPDLLLAFARIQMADAADPRPALMRVLAVAPDRHGSVLTICEELAATGHVESGYSGVDVLTDVALLEGDFGRAITALQAFLRHGPHVPALVKLVEVCVDARRDAPMREAQARLADAYLENGHAGEARVIAEDLLVAEPQCDAHVQRLRRALQLLGVDDIEAVVARALPAEAGNHSEDEVDLSNLGTPEASVASGFSRKEDSSSRKEDTLVREGDDFNETPIALEVDLSEVLSGIAPAAPFLPPGKPPQDLEAVFEQMRTQAARRQEVASAADQFERALDHVLNGRLDEAVNGLKAAARVPLFRFAAAAQLGRLHVERGELKAGVEWLERAAEAPAPTPEEGFALLYDLADALDRLGESARALAVLMELDADAAGYRDVRERVARLARDQAGSREA